MLFNDMTNSPIGPSGIGGIKYEFDSYSGSQINVMFGDTLIDNAVSLQFTEQQSKVPIYGYANQYYSFVAAGKVLVQGSLTIFFKESGYLLRPIKRFINQSINSTSPSYKVNDEGNIVQGQNIKDNLTFAEYAKKAANRKVMRANVEQMTEWEASGFPAANGAYNNFVTQLAALDDDKFENWAEVFEDSIWYGSDKTNPYTRDRLFSKNFESNVTDLTDEDIMSHRRVDQYPPIDIWVVYGDFNGQQPNHTVKKLLDVSFVGQSQVVEVSGNPTYETYNFIARNLI